MKAVYESNNIDAKIIEKIRELKDRRSILVFVPSVDNAIALADMVPGSTPVYGDMDKKERAWAVEAFKRGDIKTVFNVNVLSVGFDHPKVDAIICARPTASLAWFYQAIGRGTRIDPEKKDCLIVDFSGNVTKFGRIEKLYYKKENIWKLYGENGILLSNIAMDKVGSQVEAKGVVMTWGMHKGKQVKDIPASYRQWMLQNITWNQYNNHILKEIERLEEQVSADLQMPDVQIVILAGRVPRPGRYLQEDPIHVFPRAIPLRHRGLIQRISE